MRLIRVCIAFSLQVLLLPSIFAQANNVMYAHFINVGQGDATLLEFPKCAVLIDAGAQDDYYVDSMLIYLDDFFGERDDLDSTLETVIITHNHPDHIKGLKEVIMKYRVKHLVHNGSASGRGRGDLNWAVEHADEYPYDVNAPSFESITGEYGQDGMSLETIHACDCEGSRQDIILLSSRFEENPGWTHSDFDNENNQSMTIKVEFGRSSFIFTGDLEEQGIGELVAFYSDGDGIPLEILDADVYQVGHHGSHNATTEGLLDAITPDIAIISAGEWDYGIDGNNQFTTYWYGHPRESTLNMLMLSINKRRSSIVDVMAASGARSFHETSVRKRIYATPWDKNIKVRATKGGSLRVTRNN
jgi:beta-lactamase superfamily II metal-dependent hydrolase